MARTARFAAVSATCSDSLQSGRGQPFCLWQGVLQSPILPEVFTAAEIARASGVSEAEVLALIEAGAIDSVPVESRQPLVARREAVRAGRALAAGLPLAAGMATGAAPALFSSRPGAAGTARAPFAISTLVHAGMIAAVVVATTLGFGRAVQSADERAGAAEAAAGRISRCPGPGGGGGGGGLKMPAPPPKAQRKGRQSLSSPLPVRQPPPRPEPPRPQPPLPEVEPEPLPPVQAPVVTAPADDRDRAGVLEETAPPADSRGQGTGGGVGTGEGTGIGEGEGSGLGDGSGGGTGGGPFRPGQRCLTAVAAA